MENVLKLRNNIEINGKIVSEVKYNAEEITSALFAEADVKRKIAAGMKNMAISPAAEFDTGLHLYLGFAAIIAVNPNYDFADVERIHGTDIIDVMGIGRNFILRSEEVNSPLSNSDEQSDHTAERSSQA